MRIGTRIPWLLRLARASVIVVPLACSVSAATIGVDARHGDASSGPTDNLATGGSFEEFRAAMVAAGHTLVNLSSFTAAALAGVDALIVRQSPNTAGIFNSGEISSIHAFVNSGHGLMVLGDGGFDTNSTTGNLNILAAPFGVSFGDLVAHGEGFTITGFILHPVTNGITSIGMDFYRPLTGISAPAQDLTLLSGDDNVLAAVNGINGAGNVVLLSDTGLWSDADSSSDRTIAFGDNRLLLENAIAFVVVPEPSAWLLAITGGLIVPIFFRRRTRHGA